MKLRQGNVFYTCLWFCSQGGLCQGNPPWTKTLLDRDPPWTETPLDRDSPGQRPHWTETPRKRPPWTGTPLHRDPLPPSRPYGTHPTGIHSCLLIWTTLWTTKRVIIIRIVHNASGLTNEVILCLRHIADSADVKSDGLNRSKTTHRWHTTNTLGMIYVPSVCLHYRHLN